MNKDEEKCDICFEKTENKIMCALPCKHILCIQCLFKVTKPECHICRKFYGNLLCGCVALVTKTFEEFDRF
jgi:hypothetical protein